MAALGLGLASASLAGTVHCTTREDPAFNRLVTECSDGSRAVTRYDEQFNKWRTEITLAPGTDRGRRDSRTPGRDAPTRGGKQKECSVLKRSICLVVIGEMLMRCAATNPSIKVLPRGDASLGKFQADGGDRRRYAQAASNSVYQQEGGNGD